MDRELFRAHEEHVFQEMSEAQWSIEILQTTYSDGDGACTFL